METSPGPWISALRHSHDRLRATVEPLGLAQLEQRSYDSEWSIAQVLSHMGSQAEIFALFLGAGLTGQDPPGNETFVPIWESWNAKDPQAQAADALRADEATVERFEALDADQQARLHLKVFGRELGATGLAQMRVSEHAIHTWDVVVALDPRSAGRLIVKRVGEMSADGQLVLVSDHPAHADDRIGPVQRDDVVGRVVVRYWPASRAGLVR